MGQVPQPLKVTLVDFVALRSANCVVNELGRV